MTSLVGKLMDKTPVSFTPTGRLSFGLVHKNDPTAQMRSMGSVGTLFAIVSRLANATAQVEWKLYRTHDARGRVSGDQERREVTSHMALDVWNHPNPFYTRQEFVETFQQHVDLTGEGWWLKGSNPAMGGMPLELWPVRPDKMTPVPHPTDYLSGYTYTDPDGHEIPLDLADVIQLRMPNPLDPYRGMGPVQSVMVDLDATKYSAEWNRNFFLNSAEPGGIMQVDKRLSDDEFKELTMRWNEQHKGVSKAHRVAIIEQGQWVNRSFSMRDMQFAELRQVSRDTIMEAFGISKHMLGITEDVNRANADAGEYMFAKWMVVPRLERIKQALNSEFLPMFGTTGQGVYFDYESPVAEDTEVENADRDSKVTAVVALISAGADPEETLAAFGLPPLKWSKPVAPVAPPMPEPNANADAGVAA